MSADTRCEGGVGVGASQPHVADRAGGAGEGAPLGVQGGAEPSARRSRSYTG